MGANCRGFVTADVLVKGLSMGTIALWWRLKGVEQEERGGLPRFGPSRGGNSLRPAWRVLMWIRLQERRNSPYLALDDF